MATFDFYFQPKEEENITGFKMFTSGFNRSIAVRGPWKLICQWLKRFMTIKESDPLRPDEGTDFGKLVGANITSIADIRDVLLLSVQDCNEQIYAIQDVTQPDVDEALDVAVLDDVVVTAADALDAYVTISNIAGDSIRVRLPILATRQ